MKAAILLSGCGVYDGAEIHESVLTLLHLKRSGFDYQCFAPDVAQHHVINHRDGSETAETRNVLTESARIARGDIQPLTDFDPANFDAVVLPGGFGVAKNFTTWAFEGPAGRIVPQVANAIRATLAAKKPLAAWCMAPTTVARAAGAADGSGFKLTLTVGSPAEASPYPIADIAAGMASLGITPANCSADAPCVDAINKVVTVPCYMMEADILAVDRGIAAGIAALKKLAGG